MKEEKHLDIPSEANREMHINFMDAEKKKTTENIPDVKRFGASDSDKERRRQWQERLEEGKKSANQNHD